MYLVIYCFKISYLQQHLALQEGLGLRGIQLDPLRKKETCHAAAATPSA